MSDGSGRNTLFCHDCDVRFTIYSSRSKRHYFCPICGENTGVSRHDKRTQRLPRKQWTTGEERKMKWMMEKGHIAKEIAARLDRTEQSVRKKAMRKGWSWRDGG